MFTHVGVPQVLISDCGTNFTSQNQTCKNMLYHIVQQHGRQWHKFVPLMTWALREVPVHVGVRTCTASTVLKESWTPVLYRSP